MVRNREFLTLSLPLGCKDKLIKVASEADCYWGESPSPSLLVARIADRTLTIKPSFSFSSQEVKALLSALNLLLGKDLEASKFIFLLLLKRGDLSPSQKTNLLCHLSPVLGDWLIDILPD